MLIRSKNPVGAVVSHPRHVSVSAWSLEVDNWAKDASCVGEDPDLFYVYPSADYYTEVLEHLRGLCEGCPVLEACRTRMVAEETREGEIHGFRAGLTSEERKRLRRGALRNP